MKIKKLFTRKEMKFLIAMGSVLGLRELSMTILNPFISIYGKQLCGSTAFLCGLALGIYGLMNAVFQIPYGRLSDRIGRKPVILIGLMQLIAGMFIAFLTRNIYVFILARALQGSGAVMAIAYSWLGDNIEDSKKNSAMGITGIIVALGAVIAFGVGPLLYKIISVSDMFLGCAALIFVSWLLILISLKEDKNNKLNGSHKSLDCDCLEKRNQNRISRPQKKVLLKLSILGFVYNFILSTTFYMIPRFLDKKIGAGNMWVVFLPSVLIGIFIMLIYNVYCDKGHFIPATKLAFMMMLVGNILIFSQNVVTVSVGIVLAISGFMCLTSGVPSTVNKLFPKNVRGHANGVLQTFTFLGFFTGPTLAGFLSGKNLDSAVYIISISLCIFSEFIVAKVDKN